MNPGATTRPLASTVSAPSRLSPTALIEPPSIPTSQTRSNPDSGSMTRPPASTTSWATSQSYDARLQRGHDEDRRHHSNRRRQLLGVPPRSRRRDAPPGGDHVSRRRRGPRDVPEDGRPAGRRGLRGAGARRV